MNFTREQSLAINHSGASLLVSAAAGSGKTAVLVERVISKILADEPVSITDFLVVTFTKAAASEMREKIVDALYKRLVNEPSNRRIQRELAIIGEAKIDTIDGFYYKTVRRYGEVLDLSPSLRIGNESENLMLADGVMEALVEDYYGRGDIKFLNAIDFFSRAKDDLGFIEVVKEIIKSLETYPNPDTFLKSQLELYGNPLAFESSAFAGEIKEGAARKLEFALDCTLKAIDIASEDETFKKAYLPVFSEYKVFIETAQVALYTGWDDMQKLLERIPNTRLGAARGVDPDVVKLLKELRAYVKDTLADLAEKYFFLSKEEVLSDMEAIRPNIEILCEFIREYNVNLLREKKKRGIYDFSDLSKFMYALLIESYDSTTGEYVKTHVAEELSSEFAEIFVDEYQDTNAIQDLIFKALSKSESNLFMVGDAKQSIYRFRQAEPEIFMGKKENFTDNEDYLQNREAEKGVKISLNKNFRSRCAIIDFANLIFGLSFSKETSEMDYVGEELVFGAENYEIENDFQVEVNLISAPEAEDESEEESFSGEIDFICEKIGDILTNEKVFDTKQKKYRDAGKRDIVVLMRSLKGAASELGKRLAESGIASYCDDSESFFEKEEISLLLSFLRVIDNPIWDVHVAAIMLSPIFGFTADELAEVALLSGSSFYEKVCKFAETSAKAKSFTDKIAEYRAKSKHMSVEEILVQTILELGYEKIILSLPMGETRLQNVRLLLDYAAEFESTSFRGLFQFNRFIKKIIESGRDLKGSKSASENSDVVRIMTIHKSKGLEFPFVILADTAKKFNTQKYNNSVLIHKSLGISSKLREIESMSEYNTAQRTAVTLKMKREAISEELRCLYVALTRPKEGLYIFINTRGIQNPVRKLKPVISKDGKPHRELIAEANCLAKIILYALQFAKDGQAIRDYYSTALNGEYGSNFKVNILTGKVDVPQVVQNIEEEGTELTEVKYMQTLDYAYSLASLTPTKVSVSDLKVDSMPRHFEKVSFKRPLFLQEKSRLTSAEKGTAIHRAIECADFKQLKANSENELARLVEQGFLSEKQRLACDISKIEAFTKSEIFERMLTAKHFEKELVFNCFYDNEGERQLLQGIIDVVFADDQGCVILDFKTDRLKNEELKKRYTRQLELYKAAYEKMAGVTVERCLIYSFEQEETIDVL